MKITELKAQLQFAMASLARLEQAIFDPCKEMTLKEANAKLSCVLESFAIGMELWGGSERSNSCEWKVWDGTAHHKAKSLAGAVNQALAANQPVAEDVVAEADAALSGATT